MSWCEENQVDYVCGLARNSRLQKALEPELEQAQQLQEASGSSARVYQDFRYQTLESWSQERRVVGKAEYTSSCTVREGTRRIASKSSSWSCLPTALPPAA